MTMKLDEQAARHYVELKALAEEIDQRLSREVVRLGFDPLLVSLNLSEEAVYRLDRDPSDGSYSLVGEWRDEHGIKFGQLLFHADGSFYVEQDLVRPHPKSSHWFVEAICAWGREGVIKTEARLLPMPE